MLPWWKRWLQWLGVFVGACCVAGLAMTILVLLIFSRGLPTISDIEDLLQAESTLIMDREGNILYAVHGEENRELIELNEISPYLIDATIAVEDDQFYDHHGFVLPCYIKAVGHEFLGIGIRRGCSTITQQLVKNLFLTFEQTYTRKIQELILAVKVEARYKKNEILELYLNEIPYGNNAYGAELAARTYFDKSAAELNLTESAILAGIPKAPTRYSPYGSYRNSFLAVELTEEEVIDRNIQSFNDINDNEFIRGLLGTDLQLTETRSIYLPGRVDIVLEAMVDQGMVTESEAQTALEETWVMEFKEYRENIKYPHFVLYVKELIEEQYGTDVVEQGGLKVYTTIDPVLQDIAEESIEKYRERNATQFDANNASLVSIHPQTGQILAMVGSADYFDEEIDGNVNIATRYRQPGSSFKPFVYALTLLSGYTPASVLYDVETQIGPGEYPQNYDGEFMGPLNIRSSLALSRNIPAIKSYFLSGQEVEIIPFMEGFGIELDETIGYGWPLALGSGEVRLLDLVGAYSVFSNGGTKKTVSPILKIENSEGEVLEQWEDDGGEEVLDPQIAYLINDILSDPAINLGSRLRVSGHTVAAKTGTSNKKDEYDENAPNNAWTLGYSNKLATGVWAGNADGASMSYEANGYDVAAIIWNDFMTQALAELGSEPFTKPDGIVEMTVTKSTGLLPSEYTPEEMTYTEKFASFHVPTSIDSTWAAAIVDGFTGLVATQFSPEWSLEEKEFQLHEAIIPDYLYWQAGIDAWMEEEKIDEFLEPTDIDELHTAETLANEPTIIITSPSPYARIRAGHNTVTVEAETLNGLDKVEFYLGDSLNFTDVSAPFSGNIRIPTTAKSGDTYTITAYVYDDFGYRSESSVDVQVE